MRDRTAHASHQEITDAAAAALETIETVPTFLATAGPLAGLWADALLVPSIPQVLEQGPGPVVD